MDLKPLFDATDLRPFLPFAIELQSGRLIPVSRPENIFFLPSRQKVWHIEVFAPDTGDWALFHPAGFLALHRNQREASSGR